VSDLYVGQAIIGLVGDCASFVVGDLRVSRGTANRTASSCEFDLNPVDPAAVAVEVENHLINPIEVSFSLDDFTTLTPAPAEASTSIEVDAGFELYFESVPPELVAGEPMGEVVFKLFAPDSTPAGATVVYSVTNNIDGNHFFAPIITNETTTPLLPSVNLGLDGPEGLFCPDCFVAPGTSAGIGYYAYDILFEDANTGELATWTRDEVNVALFERAEDIPELPVLLVDDFESPDLDLEADSGAVEIILVEDAEAPAP
jgi:hypothetical protein